MKVFILATCRREDLLPYTMLVFKTFRIGFPTADLDVYCNGTSGSEIWGQPLKDVVEAIGGRLFIDDETTHHDWIHMLLAKQTEPFWICDTDVIFYRSVEGWQFDKEAPLAGYRIPEHNDPFTKSVTRSRLHTSLLYVNPAQVRFGKEAYQLRHPLTHFNPPADLINPLYLPFNNKTIFYDTLAMMYHAIGGQEFTNEQKDAYFHFHFGTFSDMVLPVLPGGEHMRTLRKAILAEPGLGIGLWRLQEEYYERNQVFSDGADVIAPIDTKDGQEARKWNIELCQGNDVAMVYCDLWYRYCHGIDDLIDTMQDGRPRMAKDQMVSLFFTAALLYNSTFYLQHRDVLAPIVLLVTNTYRDSIAWEQSSKPHLRKMGDVFRTCGNEMYVMVALICGGEAHMRKMSMAIKERDFVLQHDDSGQPL